MLQRTDCNLRFCLLMTAVLAACGDDGAPAVVEDASSSDALDASGQIEADAPDTAGTDLADTSEPMDTTSDDPSVDVADGSVEPDVEPEDGSSEEDTADGSAETDAGPVEPEWEPPFPDAVWQTPDLADGAYITAVDTCTPSELACPSPTSGRTQVFANYRKDYWLDEYNEFGDPPLVGGRVQAVALSAVSGTVTRVLINGIDADSILTPPAEGAEVPFEWYHVWPREVVAGEPVWVAFHSRQQRWDTETQFTVTVETDAGSAVDATATQEVPDVILTYVTFNDDQTLAHVHAQNRSDSARTLTGLEVQGVDSLAVACVPDATIDPGQSVLWTVPLCDAPALGDAWTVAATFDDGSHAVGAGRVLRPFFPIEAWNNTTDCPFPGTGGDEDNRGRMLGAWFDTMYTHGGVCSRCGCDTETLFNEQLPGTGWFSILTDDVIRDLRNEFTELSTIAAVSTGDESDGEIYEDDGTPRPAAKARNSLTSWLRYPELPTFNGGKTNRHIGSFAGMADIQGMDLYIAACAPHITPTGEHPLARSAYDWLVNTRNNHMPGTTWLYTQGLALTWNRGEGDDELFYQPDPQEIYVQAFSAILAGAKGLMWFQINNDEIRRAPERYQAIVNSNLMVRRVRNWLRTGDITGLAWSEPDILVDLIRSDDLIVVPVINTHADVAVTDEECLLSQLRLTPIPHWIFSTRSVDVYLDIPDDFTVADVFEVGFEDIEDTNATVEVDGSLMRLSEVELTNDRPVRLFVLARRQGMRELLVP